VGATGSAEWGGRTSAGFEADVRRLLLERLAVGVHAGWENPYRQPVQPGVLTVQQLRAWLSVEGSPIGHGLWVDALVLMQGLFAQTTGFALDGSTVRVNPALGLSLAWRVAFGALGLEVGLRQLFFLRVQEIRVDDRAVLTLPIGVTSAYLGLAYGL